MLFICLYYKCVIIVIYDHSNSNLYYKCVRAHVHWWHFLVKMLVTATDYLLALATLGDMTKIEMILSLFHHPRCPRQEVICHCRWHYGANFC